MRPIISVLRDVNQTNKLVDDDDDDGDDDGDGGGGGGGGVPVRRRRRTWDDVGHRLFSLSLIHISEPTRPY